MKKWIVAVFFLFHQIGYAQTDTVRMPVIDVTASRVQLFSFAKELVLDSLDKAQGQHLADVLTEQSGIYFKTYGQGSLASPSNRGAGFGHTNIVWNGFNLQHPMLGGMDFSLVASNLFDGISIQQNGVSSLLGSGTIGGGIYLQNKLQLDQGLQTHLGIGTGSFGEEKASTKVSYSGKKWSAELSAHLRRIDNDFPFINNRGETDEQTFAEVKHATIGQNLLYQINPQQHIKSYIWIARTDRQIPPSETEANSNATQLDESQRFGLEYQGAFRRMVLKARMGYLLEQLLFQSNVVPLSDSRTKNLIGEVEANIDLHPKLLMNIGLHQNYIQADATVFDVIKDRQEVAAFTSFRYSPFGQNTNVLLSARQANVAGDFIPFVWSLSLQHAFSKHLQIQTLVSKNYNLPTFNDLYWPGSGNADLQAESGMNTDIRFLYKKERKYAGVEINLSFYQNNIDNWIQWLPNSVGLWTPENRRSVRNQGIELMAKWEQKVGVLRFKWNGIYTLTDAVALGSNPNLDKQLIYIPKHQLKNAFGFTYQQFSFRYQHLWTSTVFTTSDNKNSLDAYGLANIQLGYTCKIWNKDWRTYFRLNNIWNADYETIPFRPMPLRHFQLGIQMEL